MSSTRMATGGRRGQRAVSSPMLSQMDIPPKAMLNEPLPKVGTVKSIAKIFDQISVNRPVSNSQRLSLLTVSSGNLSVRNTLKDGKLAVPNGSGAKVEKVSPKPTVPLKRKMKRSPKKSFSCEDIRSLRQTFSISSLLSRKYRSYSLIAPAGKGVTLNVHRSIKSPSPVKPPKVLPKPNCPSPRQQSVAEVRKSLEDGVPEGRRPLSNNNSPKPLPPPKPVVWQQQERNAGKNVSFLHSTVKSAIATAKCSDECRQLRSGLQRRSDSPPVALSCDGKIIKTQQNTISTANCANYTDAVDSSAAVMNSTRDIVGRMAKTESDYAIYGFHPAHSSSTDGLNDCSVTDLQVDTGLMTLNGSQLDISGHIYSIVQNGMVVDADESFEQEEEIFEQVDGEEDEPITPNIPADEVVLRRASGAEFFHNRSGGADELLGKKRRSQSLTDAVLTEVFDLLRQAPTIPPQLPPARLKSMEIEKSADKSVEPAKDTTSPPKIGPPTLPKSIPLKQLSRSVTLEEYAEITELSTPTALSERWDKEKQSVSVSSPVDNSPEPCCNTEPKGLIEDKKFFETSKSKQLMSRESAMTRSLIVLPESARAQSEDRSLPDEPTKDCLRKEGSHKGLKKLVKKFRPVSQQFQDMGKLFRIRSDIQVNMAKTVGSIKLKVSSNSNNMKRADITKSSVFYLGSPNEKEISENEWGPPAECCSNCDQTGVDPPPVPPPRSTSIRITVEATANRSGSSTTSSTESQPTTVKGKFSVTEGKAPRPRVRRTPAVGQSSRRHTVDDVKIKECRERHCDEDFADDFSSGLETSSDEGNETADDSFAPSSKTSSSPTGDLDLTPVVKDVRLSSPSSIEKSSTLKAESSNFPSFNGDESFEDGVDHIYNSRFAFSEPFYQVYRKESAAKIYRTQTISSADNTSSVKAQRREMMVQASTFGSQRSLWCEIPEVKRSGMLETLSSQERKGQESMFEIITSEASYLKSLNVLITHFMASHEFSGKPGSILTGNDRRTLFSNILSVRDASESLLCALENKLEENLMLSNVAAVVNEHLTKDTEVYVKYCSNQIYQERMLNLLRKTNVEFVRALESLEKQPNCQGLSMRSFMLLPMQRVTRYPLLMDAVYRHTAEDSPYLDTAKRGMAVATKLVTLCNDGAKRIERVEQLMELEKKLIFGENVRTAPVVSTNRWLVKQGVVHHIYYKHQTRTIGRRMTASSLSSPPRSRPLHLFLLTDLLLVTKKRKHADVFVILDYAARSMVEASNLELSCAQVPPGTAGILPTSNHSCLFSLTLMRNHNEKQIELVVVADTETEKARWVEAFQSAKSEGLEDIYETWDCPQAVASVDVIGTQDDELSLEAGDILNILRRTRDGWCEGERLRDGSRGWFLTTNVVEVVSDHVRAKNFRLRLRLLQAAGIVHVAQPSLPSQRSKALQ